MAKRIGETIQPARAFLHERSRTRNTGALAFAQEVWIEKPDSSIEEKPVLLARPDSSSRKGIPLKDDEIAPTAIGQGPGSGKPR